MLRCSFFGALAAVVLAGVASAADKRMTPGPALQRQDGSQIIAYVDRQGRTGRQGVILIAQGSGCGSVLKSVNVAGAKTRLLRDFAVLTIEDYGVTAGDPDLFSQEKCPAAYYKHHTISQRVADARQALALLAKQPWWDGRLVLFGGSEGGAVVQELAPLVPARAVVVYSSATGVPFRDAVVQVLPPPVAEYARSQLDEVRRNPQSSDLLLSNSRLWWADIMDRRLSDDLLKAKAPILVVQGERDESNPVMSARAVRDAFVASGRSNLTYLELAGYNHHMQDAQGVDHFDEVMARISEWLRAQVNDPVTEK